MRTTLRSNSAGNQGLTRTRGTDQQQSDRRGYAAFPKDVWVAERQLDDVSDEGELSISSIYS